MGALMARLNMARPQPVQPISVHVSFYVSFYVSLALSPLGFSCVSMCVWSLVYSGAFWRILVHSCAFMCILKHHEASKTRPGAHRNRVFFLLSALEYIIMHLNASQIECSTFKMHQAENVLKCVKMRHVRMQHTKNAHECILCNECTRMQQDKKMQP